MPYSKSDLREAYRAVGVTSGRTVYLTSDLGRLMDFERPGRQAVLDAHLEVLLDLLGSEGTLVASVASMNLCNTDTPFDPAQTPSFRMGAFSEHLRCQPGVSRSFHPFVSYAALGRNAAAITERVARQSFGPETPEARLIEAGALTVSVGLAPNFTCSTVHHVEQCMAVPYRYAKEYLHPVVRGGATVTEAFYQYVWYRDIDLKRDYARKVFARFEAENPVSYQGVGRAGIWGYETAAFWRSATRALAEDIYMWCETPPTIRPYRT